MENIVLLTGLVPKSQSALDYGFMLAQEKNLPVVLLHVYDIPTINPGDPFSPSVLPITEMHEVATGKLAKLVQTYQERYPQLSIQTRVAIANAEWVLDEDTDTRKSLIITGIADTGTEDWWEDDRGLDILRDAHHNVLGVHEGYAYHPVQNITLALDYRQEPESLPLNSLHDILTLTGAQLHVVTVNGPDALPQPLADALLPFAARHTNIRQADDVDAALSGFIDSRQPTDWLAVIPGTYGFWRSLFHKSHTAALAGMTRMPLLALHQP